MKYVFAVGTIGLLSLGGLWYLCDWRAWVRHIRQSNALPPPDRSTLRRPEVDPEWESERRCPHCGQLMERAVYGQQERDYIKATERLFK